MRRPRRRVRLATLGRALVVLAAVATVVIAIVRYTGLQERGFRMMGLAGASVTFTWIAAATALLGTALAVVGNRRPTRSDGVRLLPAALPFILLLQITWPALWGVVAPERASEGARLTVLTQNLWYRNDEIEATLDDVLGRNADVLVLTEFTPEYEQLLDERADATDIRAEYPYQWRRPRPRGGGLAVLSSLPYDGPPEVLPLTDPAVRIRLRTRGGPVDLYALHPRAPSNHWGIITWQRDYDVLVDELAGAGPRTVMAGDFNATTGHRRFRELLRAGELRDVHDVGGAGVRGTWPSGRFPVPFPIMRLDHVLVGPGIGVEDVHILDHNGSDHRGVEAWLRVSPP